LKVTALALRAQRPFKVEAWVLLPDHMHCIWTLPDNDRDYSARWGWYKKEVSKRLRSEGLIRAASLWQPRFWEHRIRDGRDLWAHCDYIHFNPVKHGLVRDARDWPWSTLHRFIDAGIYPADWGRHAMAHTPNVGSE
jgi:putative transposase